MNICFGSDDLAAPHGSDKIWARLYDELKGYPTDGGANTCWNPFWKGIYQANNVIANYKMVPSIDDLKNASAAQAYFLRAWAYYMLVRSFGSVPLVLGSTDVSVKLPRAAVNDVYALIVSDLQTAINLFPASFPSLPDRTNPLAAKALLTDVYLTMTGWPLNDANKYASAAATGYCCQKYRIEH
jgi:hypothetical protein